MILRDKLNLHRAIPMSVSSQRISVPLSIPNSQRNCDTVSYPGDAFEKPWFEEITETVNQVGKRPEEGKDPFNLLVFTNNPHHYGRDNEPDPANDVLCFLSQHPEVAAKYPAALVGIYDAAMQYQNIPNEFPEKS